MSAAQTKSPGTLLNDRLLSMRQIADRWGLKTTAAALERVTKASIPIVRQINTDDRFEFAIALAGV
jgi:hypothetical protein